MNNATIQMKLEALNATQDHASNEYSKEGNSIVMYFGGFYSIAEIEMKLDALKEANALLNLS